MICNFDWNLLIIQLIIRKQKMNLLDQIITHIIRPTRDNYKIGALGQQNFTIKSKIDQTNLQVKREDSIIHNKYNQKIHLSLYKIDKRFFKENNFPCMIYLHANNGSRIEGLTYLKYFLQNQFNVVLFDCSGSGISDGQFITLGLRQSQDLECVVDFLVNKRKIKTVGLWGRSMGAVTALLYANKHIKQLKVCIYDSPFSSLKKLIKQIASMNTGLPKCFFTPFMDMIEQDIKKKTSASINDLKLKNRIQSIQCPGCFITSKNDKLVNYEHTQKLYNLYPSQKQIHYIQNEHHENRSKEIIQTCIQFLKEKFRMCQISEKNIKQKKYYLKVEKPVEEKIKPVSKTIYNIPNLHHSISKSKKQDQYQKPQIRSVHSISTAETHRLLSNQKQKQANKISVSSLKSIKRPISNHCQDPFQMLKKNTVLLHQQYNPQQRVLETKSPGLTQSKKMIKKASPINVIDYKNNFISRMNSENNLNNRFNTPLTKLNVINKKQDSKDKLIKKNMVKK